MRLQRSLLFIITILVVYFVAPARLNAGTITGEVKFIDSPPKSPTIKVTKDQDYCGETLPNDTYLIDANTGLKNVVIFIESAPPGKPADPQKENFLYNDGCRYVPRVLAMRKGERLRVRNNDPKLHIPHSYLNDKTVFMLSLPFKNTVLDATQKIRETGVLKIVCDTHAWMLGYIHVFDHPYFTVTNEQGTFSIVNVPAGTYTLNAWHEDAGLRSQEITVTQGGETHVSFDFGGK